MRPRLLALLPALTAAALAGGSGGPGLRLGATPVHPNALTGGRGTDAVIAASDGLYAVIGRQWLSEARVPYRAEDLRSVTVTDLFQTPHCDELTCDLLGWQQRPLAPARVGTQGGRVTLKLEDARRSETRAGRNRFGPQLYRVDYLAALRFKDGRTLHLLLYSPEVNPAWRAPN